MITMIIMDDWFMIDWMIMIIVMIMMIIDKGGSYNTCTGTHTAYL